ncbi:hypothetical protein MAMC_01547 [Methylacidimicrobium cyclopophantes]|uniref:Uncharacterized protein n=1 Tax=Methylacidimicrobium cyclopophantes TaxID=1041766 RepID=A0A5E6MMM8_9BACT|nr:hypothetical protein MAMC_01547 [Methylacidimicrobium cyclopophantes]
MRLRPVAPEPTGGQAGDLLERARLLEEMGRCRHHSQYLFAAELPQRLLIEAEDQAIGSPHDQQGGASYLG